MATPEEKEAVRKFLVEHPEERERVVMLMDDFPTNMEDRDEDKEERVFDTQVFNMAPSEIPSPVSLIKMAANATFRVAKKVKRTLSDAPLRKKSTFEDRLSELLEEVEKADIEKK
jgi:hypothetical protein